MYDSTIENRNLRPDTLAMIMSLANVKCEGKYGVFDEGCQGMITASILDRMQGQGKVFNLCFNGSPQKYSNYQIHHNSFKNY